MKPLAILYLQNNPAIRQISQYRKSLVAELACLSQLDDRPVTELDHTLAAAFMRGGREEETRVKTELADARNSKAKADRAAFAARAEQAKANRKLEMRKMLDNLKVQKEGLVSRRVELTEEIAKMPKSHPDYFKTRDKIRHCDEELSAEWY